MKNKSTFILLAGGSSTRMGGQKKELLPLADGLNALALITQTLNQVDNLSHLHLVYTQDYHSEAMEAVAKFKGLVTSSLAGISRQDSVWKALQAVASYQPQWVMIHDGARPWVSVALIGRLQLAWQQHEAVLPIIPLTDSLKRVNEHQMVIEECNRAEYGLAQTPQAFHFAPIYQAHEALQGVDHTDDTSLYYTYHHRHAYTILGEVTNKKITYKEDLV